MAPDVQESPFVKDLASSDPSTREKALESLRIYLSSNRRFTDLDLLKLWRGLFFSLWHTPPPHASQRLCASLSSLLASLSPTFFPRFLSVFWITIITNYTSIPSLRLDKYLLLIRYYIRDSFAYLKNRFWDLDLVDILVNVVSGDWKKVEVGSGPLNPRDGKVPDGVRYHVLDIWVDELEGAIDEDGIEVAVAERLMEPIRRLREEGRTKLLKGRAREVLEDDRVQRWLVAKGGSSKSGDKARKEILESGDDGEEEEWNGFED